MLRFTALTIPLLASLLAGSALAQPVPRGIPPEASPVAARAGDAEASRLPGPTQAEMVARIRLELEAQRRRDRTADSFYARWDHAVCEACGGAAVKPGQNLRTEPHRVLSGVRAADDDRRRPRPRGRRAALGAAPGTFAA